MSLYATAEARDGCVDRTQVVEKDAEVVVCITGLNRILQLPDFFNHAHVANLAGLIEDMDRLRSLVETRSAAEKPVVTIGAEHEDDLLDMLAIIRRGYYVGRNFGTLAVLAPKRVDYGHVCAVLDYLSSRMPELLRIEG